MLGDTRSRISWPLSNALIEQWRRQYGASTRLAEQAMLPRRVPSARSSVSFVAAAASTETNLITTHIRPPALPIARACVRSVTRSVARCGVSVQLPVLVPPQWLLPLAGGCPPPPTVFAAAHASSLAFHPIPCVLMRSNGWWGRRDMRRASPPATQPDLLLLPVTCLRLRCLCPLRLYDVGVGPLRRARSTASVLRRLHAGRHRRIGGCLV